MTEQFDHNFQTTLESTVSKSYNPGISAFFGVLTVFAIVVFAPATIYAWRVLVG